MCSGLTITMFVRFFDKYYLATIPKSRSEFVRFFLNFLWLFELASFPGLPAVEPVNAAKMDSMAIAPSRMSVKTAHKLM